MGDQLVAAAAAAAEVAGRRWAGHPSLVQPASTVPSSANAHLRRRHLLHRIPPRCLMAGCPLFHVVPRPLIHSVSYVKGDLAHSCVPHVS